MTKKKKSCWKFRKQWKGTEEEIKKKKKEYLKDEYCMIKIYNILVSQKISLPSEMLNVRFFYATEKGIVHDYSGDNFGDYVKKKKKPLNL